ncbi:MAG: hypothetical protein IJ017_07150 [Oscillospiraceae bacterium]|nr:hypothetical protein [Oscillospiraceae bacterium]
MTGYLTDYKGQRFKLPSFISWEINHTDGEDGTDSFEIKLPYDKSMRQTLEDAVKFRLEYEGETVFCGVVDEYEVKINQNGMTAAVSGRGMGAYLLDNRCVGREFVSCTLSDMLRNYVTPYGVKVGECDSMPPMYGYSVSVNESCLSALAGYTMFAGGVTPRFSKEGKLVLSGKKGSKYKADMSKVTDITLRSRRYGVLSSVKVVTTKGVVQTAENESFAAKGGSASAVVSVPRKTSWDMIRYTGNYQLEKSQKGRYSLELTVNELFPCFPMDVCIIDSDFCEKGGYVVSETCCFGDENGFGTTVKLYKEDA